MNKNFTKEEIKRPISIGEDAEHNSPLGKQKLNHTNVGTFLAVQWLRICMPIQGTWFNPWLWNIPKIAQLRYYGKHLFVGNSWSPGTTSMWRPGEKLQQVQKHLLAWVFLGQAGEWGVRAALDLAGWCLTCGVPFMALMCKGIHGHLPLCCCKQLAPHA